MRMDLQESALPRDEDSLLLLLTVRLELVAAAFSGTLMDEE